jgi:multiple sugar transport system ATP-binding protein
MLSGGQRQRVAIGRAIVREPAVFLFDEPLSNLDAELRVRMRYEFARLHQRLRTTTVYVTHDQVEAMTLADRIAILDKGEIVQLGTPDALYERPVNMFVAGFIGSPRMNLLAGTVLKAGPGLVRVRLDSGAELDAAVDAAGARAGDKVTVGIRPEHLRPQVGGVAAGVTLIESLGNIRFAYLTGDGSDPLIVQLSAQDDLSEGARVTVGADPANCHVFNAQGAAFARAAPGPGTLAA